jgi:hypothetical protein
MTGTAICSHRFQGLYFGIGPVVLLVLRFAGICGKSAGGALELIIGGQKPEVRRRREIAAFFTRRSGSCNVDRTGRLSASRL